MGQLVDGTWQVGTIAPDKNGAFNRAAATFRDTQLAPVAGRYHLYVSYACPWAHRTLMTRALRGLESALSVTVVSPLMGAHGWPFASDDPDPIGPSTYLSDVYVRAVPTFTGRVTVPVLWDRETGTIVNNESREVMRILDDWALATGPSLAPPELRGEVDQVLDAIYQPINNGVYRAGFARTQAAYEAAVGELFTALAHWDGVLADRPFVTGATLTEADLALFSTCLRFDLVYYSHFKCNVKRLQDHANLWRFTRRMWHVPAIRATCHLDHIKTHYYWSQDNVNPTRIVPVGPGDYESELDREPQVLLQHPLAVVEQRR